MYTTKTPIDRSTRPTWASVEQKPGAELLNEPTPSCTLPTSWENHLTSREIKSSLRVLEWKWSQDQWSLMLWQGWDKWFPNQTLPAVSCKMSQHPNSLMDPYRTLAAHNKSWPNNQRAPHHNLVHMGAGPWHLGENKLNSKSCENWFLPNEKSPRFPQCAKERSQKKY